MEHELLGKYELLEQLGRGGMGEVWKAHDTQLRRYVAIKLLHANLQANPDFVAHFMREAQLVASLHHANIVQIHDFQLVDKQGSSIKAYMVMDYLEGGTLSDYMHNTVRKGLFPQANEMLELFASISLALDYAHQKGMIHRDIKPANILLDKPVVRGKAIGEPILTDFGIARLQGASTSTVTRAFIGTPLYISPEQAASQEIDRRSDLYSLGIVLYEMLTGVTPFQGDNPFTVMMKHLHEKPISPDSINPRLSPAVTAVVLRCIAKDPQDRFPSAAAMTIAMAQALNLPVPGNLGSMLQANGPAISTPLSSPGFQPNTIPQVLIDTPAISHTPVSTGSTPGNNSTFATSPFSPTVGNQDKTEMSSMIREGNYSQPSGPYVSPTVANQDKTEMSSIIREGNTSAGRMREPSSLTYPPPPLPVPSPARPFGSRNRLFILLICLLLVVVVGVGASALLLLRNNQTGSATPGAANGVAGHIVFARSSGAPAKVFDQLKIDLTNVAAPPGGKTYYAWLVVPASEENEASYPHWALRVSNGAVHDTFSAASASTDLFAPSSKFLITEEESAPDPTIPAIDLNLRLYYADLAPSSSSSPTFDIRRCPSGDTSNTCKYA